MIGWLTSEANSASKTGPIAVLLTDVKGLPFVVTLRKVGPYYPKVL